MKIRTFFISAVARILVVVFSTNLAFATQPEQNFWKERAKENLPMLASLPGLVPPPPHVPLLNRALRTETHPNPSSIDFMAAPKLRQTLSRKSAHIPRPLSKLPASFLAQVNIRESYRGQGSRGVVIMEDVHLNQDAQSRLYQAIRALEDVPGQQLVPVGLEGAQGETLYALFQSAASPEINTFVAGSYLQEGWISGPAAAGFTTDLSKVEFWGVDDNALYEANVRAYHQSKNTKKRTEAWLRLLQADIDSQKKDLYSPALLMLDETVLGFRQGQVSMGNYLEALASHGVSVSFNVETFLEAHRMEATFDMDAISAERSKLINQLVHSFNKSELDDLHKWGLAYQQGLISFADYHAHLKSLCINAGFNLSETPHFDDYIRYVLLVDGIQAEGLFKESADLERALMRSLAPNDQALHLIESDRLTHLIKKLIDFSLTSYEWEDYHLSQGARHPQLEPYETFYRMAQARDRAMAEALLLRSKGPVSALVAGGFHTKGLSRALQEKGVPYLVVTPKMTRLETDNDVHFLSVFDREKSPLEKIFAGKKLHLTQRPGGTPGAPLNASVAVSQTVLSLGTPNTSNGPTSTQRQLLDAMGASASVSETINFPGAHGVQVRSDKGTVIVLIPSSNASTVPRLNRLFWRKISPADPALRQANAHVFQQRSFAHQMSRLWLTVFHKKSAEPKDQDNGEDKKRRSKAKKAWKKPFWKPWQQDPQGSQTGVAFDPAVSLTALALVAAAVLDSHLFGISVLTAAAHLAKPNSENKPDDFHGPKIPSLIEQAIRSLRDMIFGPGNNSHRHLDWASPESLKEMERLLSAAHHHEVTWSNNSTYDFRTDKPDVDLWGAKAGAMAVAYVNLALDHIAKEFSPEVANARPIVIVGRDARETARAQQQDGMKALLMAGAEVKDISPEQPGHMGEFFFALQYLNSIYGDKRPVIGIFYTASHVRGFFGGMKGSFGVGNRLSQLTEQENRNSWTQKATRILQSGRFAFRESSPRSSPFQGTHTSADYSHDHQRWLMILGGAWSHSKKQDEISWGDLQRLNYLFLRGNPLKAILDANAPSRNPHPIPLLNAAAHPGRPSHKPFKDLKVVVDTGHAGLGRTAPDVLRELGATVLESRTRIEPLSAQHEADPSVPEFRSYALEILRDEKGNNKTSPVDLAFVSDLDGDRGALLTTEGTVLRGDLVGALIIPILAAILRDTNYKYVVAVDPKCSGALHDVIKKHSDVFVLLEGKTGYPNLLRAIYQEVDKDPTNLRPGVFIEKSGHLGTFFTGMKEDPVATLILILRAIAQNKKTGGKGLSSLMEEIPEFYSTEDIRVPLHPALYKMVDPKIQPTPGKRLPLPVFEAASLIAIDHLDELFMDKDHIIEVNLEGQLRSMILASRIENKLDARKYAFFDGDGAFIAWANFRFSSNDASWSMVIDGPEANRWAVEPLVAYVWSLMRDENLVDFGHPDYPGRASVAETLQNQLTSKRLVHGKIRMPAPTRLDFSTDVTGEDINKPHDLRTLASRLEKALAEIGPADPGFQAGAAQAIPVHIPSAAPNERTLAKVHHIQSDESEWFQVGLYRDLPTGSLGAQLGTAELRRDPNTKRLSWTFQTPLTRQAGSHLAAEFFLNYLTREFLGEAAPEWDQLTKAINQDHIITNVGPDGRVQVTDKSQVATLQWWPNVMLTLAIGVLLAGLAMPFAPESVLHAMIPFLFGLGVSALFHETGHALSIWAGSKSLPQFVANNRHIGVKPKDGVLLTTRDILAGPLAGLLPILAAAFIFQGPAFIGFASAAFVLNLAALLWGDGDLIFQKIGNAVAETPPTVLKDLLRSDFNKPHSPLKEDPSQYIANAAVRFDEAYIKARTLSIAPPKKLLQEIRGIPHETIGGLEIDVLKLYSRVDDQASRRYQLSVILGAALLNLIKLESRSLNIPIQEAVATKKNRVAVVIVNNERGLDNLRQTLSKIDSKTAVVVVQTEKSATLSELTKQALVKSSAHSYTTLDAGLDPETGRLNLDNLLEEAFQSEALHKWKTEMNIHDIFETGVVVVTERPDLLSASERLERVLTIITLLAQTWITLKGSDLTTIMQAARKAAIAA